MRLQTARAAAADWVAAHAAVQAWFGGAYLGGSAAHLPPEAELPTTSDLDVFLVSALDPPPAKPGKLVHRGALLELTPIAKARLASPDAVLADHHLAGPFRTDTRLADPSGFLGRLQADVARRFAQERWVRRRCESARRAVEVFLGSIDPAAPWHAQVTSWLFGTGVTAHVPLVAALRNPTVRLRYLRAREVLRQFGQADLYAEMLDLLGCRDMAPERAARHVDALGRTFDAAAAALRSPYRFAADISALARRIPIDGSRALVRAGDHREAVFWVVATFARCHAVLAADAPELRAALAPDFAAILADLGIRDGRDLRRRAGAVLAFLPRLWAAAEAIIAAQPAIVRA